MYCEKCGVENGDDSVFCISCGNRIKEVVEEAAVLKENISAEEQIRRATSAVHSKFNDFAGIESLEGFCLKRLLSEVFGKHSEADIEESFCIGTPGTIPDIKDVDTDWPRPWMFFRAFAASLLGYLLFSFAWEFFENPNLIPGLMLIGTVAIPLAALTFFFEINVRRNISLYRMMRLFALGGVFSIIFTLILFSLPLKSLGWMGDSVAGLIEEPGKLLALIVVARSTKCNYKLNGLVMGAAVGTGFAVFESLGYACNVLIEQVLINQAAESNYILANSGLVQDPVGAMLDIVVLRGMLSPLGHIIWTAICGAALWRVKGDKSFSFSMIQDKRFWRLFIVPVILHIIWNADFQLPYYAKYIGLGVVGWTIVLALLQEGLRELHAEKLAKRAEDKNNEIDNV